MTVVKLKIENHPDVLELFSEEAPNYQFLINDLLDQNYSSASFKVFGEYDDAGQLMSFLLNNDNNITYYAQSKRPIDVYLDTLKDCTFSKISGPSVYVKQLLPHLNEYQMVSDTLSYMGVVREVHKSYKYLNRRINTVMNEHELGMLYDLFTSSNEYSLNKNKDDYVMDELNRLKTSRNRIFFLAKGGQIVSTCMTNRESRTSAIITGVITNPNYRGTGLGTELIGGVCHLLLSEGKAPYLFYNNPIARRLYINIGMTEVCEWRVVLVDKRMV